MNLKAKLIMKYIKMANHLLKNNSLINFVDVIILLPKKDFTSSNLKQILDKLVIEGINYEIISEDYLAEAVDGSIFKGIPITKAIKENYYSKFLFIPGGPGALKLMDKVLFQAFLNKYDLVYNYIALEKEAISLLIFNNKISGRIISRVGVDLLIYVEKSIIGVNKTVVEDNNLLTTNSYYSKEFVSIFIERILEYKNSELKNNYTI